MTICVQTRGETRGEPAAAADLLEALVRHAPVGIVVLRTDGRTALLNEAATELLPRGAHVTDLPLLDASGRSVPAELQPARRALRGETVHGYETRVALGGTREAHVRVDAAPIRDSAGGTTGAILYFQDYSALGKLDAEQRHAWNVLGNELRGPLTAISVSAEVLARAADLPPRRRAGAERIHTSVRRLSRMVTDVLEYARSVRGPLPLQREPADLVELVRRGVETALLEAPGREVRVFAPAPVPGGWDASRVELLVEKLVDNALRHGAAARPVDVCCEVRGLDAAIDVADCGPGIAEDAREGLFLPFRSGGGASGRLGLGLYLAREFARAHGGELDVTSQPGGPTCARVRMPIGGRA